jgi:hypothetical protein
MFDGAILSGAVKTNVCRFKAGLERHPLKAQAETRRAVVMKTGRQPDSEREGIHLIECQQVYFLADG